MLEPTEEELEARAQVLTDLIEKLGVEDMDYHEWCAQPDALRKEQVELHHQYVNELVEVDARLVLMRQRREQHEAIRVRLEALDGRMRALSLLALKARSVGARPGISEDAQKECIHWMVKCVRQMADVEEEEHELRRALVRLQHEQLFGNEQASPQEEHE